MVASDTLPASHPSQSHGTERLTDQIRMLEIPGLWNQFKTCCKKRKEMGKLTHRIWCKQVEGPHWVWDRQYWYFLSLFPPHQSSLLMVWLRGPEMRLQQAGPQTEVCLGQWHTMTYTVLERCRGKHTCSLPVSLLSSSKFYLCSLGKGYVDMGFTDQCLN